LGTGVSIVTVVRNDLEGIKKTAASINRFSQDFVACGGQLEWIIVDGASTDGTAAFSTVEAKELLDCPVRAVSERDNGLYDAMNKGTRMAQHSHCWYLNAGDDICDLRGQADSVLKAIRVNIDAIICFGCLRSGKKGEVIVSSRSEKYLEYSLPTSHQAMIVPTSVALAHPYSSQYLICGDYDFACRAWLGGCRFVTNTVTLARFVHDGLSSKRPVRLLKEAASIQRNILGLGWPTVIAMTFRRSASLLATKLLDHIPVKS
jgi:putative colanic acid biosynthesis glycosyltransferase